MAALAVLYDCSRDSRKSNIKRFLGVFNFEGKVVYYQIFFKKINEHAIPGLQSVG